MAITSFVYCKWCGKAFIAYNGISNHEYHKSSSVCQYCNKAQNDCSEGVK